VKQLTTNITIEGSPEAVWTTLMDFGAYSDWNPFVREITGNPAIGEQLSVLLQNPDSKAMSISPVITEVEPGRRFSWLGKLGFKGLFDGHHHFEIERIDAGTVRFTQSEDFSGALVPIVWPMIGKKTRAGFESMNTELKARVESR
jgi:hypothetical protein